ncbi:MAG TPA: hypothetical protein PLU62_11710 [Ignavibacteriales bacterium]|nr:hypothetical protein [Ignavibacteriales bacterium]
MPAINPILDVYGVKVVSRYPKRKPSIKGELLLYSFSSGELLAFMDATWITTKRTAAVATLAVKTLAKRNYKNIAIAGFGQVGYSFVEMITSLEGVKDKVFKLLEYKNQASEMKKYLRELGVNNVEICHSNEDFIKNSDVIVSAVTVARELFGNDEWYEKGVLVVPIHTRGFQNCDLFFDKVFADDTAHVSDFANFSKFKQFDEFDKVIKNEIRGRSNDDERILSYNIGIALHDIFLAKKIYDNVISKSI